MQQTIASQPIDYQVWSTVTLVVFPALLLSSLSTCLHLFRSSNYQWDYLGMVPWSPLSGLIYQLLILLLFLLNLLMILWLLGVCYELNELFVCIPNHHIWSPRCCFRSYTIFKVPAKIYHVIFRAITCMYFSLYQYWRFSSTPFLTARVVIKISRALFCLFRYSLLARS